jgi:hypothetical protein
MARAGAEIAMMMREARLKTDMIDGVVDKGA